MRRKLNILIIALLVVLSLTACDMFKSDTAFKSERSSTIAKVEEIKPSDTLVIGTKAFEGNFSPFYAAVRPDTRVNDMVFSKVCIMNETSELISNAGTITKKEIHDSDDSIKQMLYTIELKKNMEFSDGKPMTIDDLLFTYYIYGDPNYDGISSLMTLDIVGLNEYYYDAADYEEHLQELEAESMHVNENDKIRAAVNFSETELEKKGAKAINDEYSLHVNPLAEDFEKRVQEAFLNDCKSKLEQFTEQAGKEKYDRLEKDYIGRNLNDGIDIPVIEGIKRLDDYTCTVLVDGVNINAERLLGIQPILPKHYYGVWDDGTEFVKGDIELIKDKNDFPIGSGPYVFEQYEGDTVTLLANPNYFKGEPKIKKLEIKAVAEASKLEDISRGAIHITDVSGSKELADTIDQKGIRYSLVDNNGFGYIAISAKQVSDIYMRKGIMHLIDRTKAVEDFFGETASVIERPMSAVVAEYPKGAKEYYGYNQNEAVKFFKKAGYARDSQGILKNERNEGISLTVGVSDFDGHPSSAILNQLKQDLESLGGELVIKDIPSDDLFASIQRDELDMWVAAWGTFYDCDLTSFYHSSQIGDKGLNYVKLRNETLDRLLEKCSRTPNLQKRMKLVEEELDIIMEEAVCMPVYQRKNLILYNSDIVNMETVPDSSNPYYNYVSQIEMLELN